MGAISFSLSPETGDGTFPVRVPPVPQVPLWGVWEGWQTPLGHMIWGTPTPSDLPMEQQQSSEAAPPVPVPGSQSLAPSPQTLSFLCTWEAKCTEPSPAPERSFQLCSKAGRAADQIWRELEPHFCLFVFKKSPRGTAKANAATTYNTKLTQPLFLFFGLSNGKLEPLALSLPSTANLFLQSDTLFREVWHCPGTVQGGSHTKPRRNSDEENEQHLHFTFSRNK